MVWDLFRLHILSVLSKCVFLKDLIKLIFIFINEIDKKDRHIHYFLRKNKIIIENVFVYCIFSSSYFINIKQQLHYR